MNLRRERESDDEIFRSLYVRWLVHHPGNLQRTKFIWGRVRDRHMLRVGLVRIERWAIAKHDDQRRVVRSR